MNNIPVYKFLFPTSLIMLGASAAIFFLGWMGLNFSSNMLVICAFIFFLGFVSFVISWIDLSISRKRVIVSGEENVIPQKSHKVFKIIGIIIISVVVVFCAILFYIMSTMWS